VIKATETMDIFSYYFNFGLTVCMIILIGFHIANKRSYKKFARLVYSPNKDCLIFL